MIDGTDAYSKEAADFEFATVVLQVKRPLPQTVGRLVVELPG